MSAVAAISAPQWAGTPTDSLANLGVYSTFTWRRNWLRLLVWALVTVGMIAFVAYYYLGTFVDDKGAVPGMTCPPMPVPPDVALTGECKLLNFGAIAQVPPMTYLIGALNVTPFTLGAAVWSKYFMFGSLMLMIGMVYLVTRNLRGDEDAGRAELTRAYPLGIHSRLIATVWITSAACLIMGLVTGPILTATFAKSPLAAGTTGDFWFGVSIGTMGILGVGIGALVNQLAPTNGGANGMGLVIIAVFYIMRVVADMQDSTALMWASPIGWGELVQPWGANRWWAAMLQVVLAAVCVAIAWALEQRRDLGAGLVAARSGSSKASRFTTTSVGLSLRTQRASIIAWLLGVVVMGDLLGSIVNKFAGAFGSLGGSYNLHDIKGVVALMATIMAIMIAAFGIQSVSTLRANEEAGLAEAQLAGPLSRTGWALQRIAVALVVTTVILIVAGAMMGYAYGNTTPELAISLTSFAGATLAYLPAVALLMSVFVLGFGWWPRQSVTVAWAVMALMFIIMIVGVATRIPQKILDLMPFQALWHVPTDPMKWTPIVVISGIAIVLTVVGLVGFQRRNVPVL